MRRGQIIPRGKNVWLVKMYKGRVERPDGTFAKKYVSQTVHGPKRNAEAVLNKWLTEKRQGTFVEPSRELLTAYLERWLSTAAPQRANTQQEYRAVLTRYVKPTLGDRRLSELRPSDVQGLYTDMATLTSEEWDGRRRQSCVQERGADATKENGGKKTGRQKARNRQLSPRTIRITHTVLSAALKQAVSWGELPRNPAAGAKLPKVQRREMHALSSEQAASFQKAAAANRHGVLFMFALATGMRPSEYLALRWKDVDFKAGTMTVQRVVLSTGARGTFADPKTDRSRRTIPLPASTVKALREHRLQSKFKGPDDLVFPGEDGQPLDAHNLAQRHFKPLAKAAGLPEGFRLYDLRHSCATLLLAAGINPKVVSERLGHASIKLTLDVYSYVLPNIQQEAAAKLDAILAPGKTAAPA